MDFAVSNYTNPQTSEYWWRNGVNVTVVLRRQSSYYTATFVAPTVLISALTICGLFIPSRDRGDRVEKCTLGLTGLLTIAVILLMVADMTPRAKWTEFSLLSMDSVDEFDGF